MARTYLTTLSPRRRWGIASAAAGVVLAVTAGLGEPWGYSSISGLPKDSGFSSVPLLSSTLQVFHWTTASSGLGGSKPWIAAFALDLAWPLFILIGTRALAGGLALRRARFSLIVGVWSVTTFTGALAGVVAGLVDHTAGSRSVFSVGATHTGDILALQAATMALVGVLVGWLPGVAAALAYSGKRPEPEAEATGEERTLVEGGSTLSLENLEELRQARRGDSPMGDASTSEFFRV